MYKLLVLDTSYSLEAIRQRQLESAIYSRGLAGFFVRVWSVHPLAPLVTSSLWGSKFGAPKLCRLCKGMVFIEGKLGNWNLPRVFNSINLVCAQITLLLLLVRLIRKEKIDFIRSGDPLYCGGLGLILSKISGVPLLIRVGSNNEEIYMATKKPMMPRLFRYRSLERVVERIVLSNANMVIGANRNNLDFAIASGAKPERTELVRYGNLIHPAHLTDPKARDPCSCPVITARDKSRYSLLYIGRLEEVKLVDHVIRLIAHLRGMGMDANLLICGDGSLRFKLECQARALGVSESVLFAGNRNQEWLAGIIPTVSLVVSPHTGRALCEVAYGGAAVVAYDIDWQGEIIEDGVTGRLVPYNDEPALLSAVLEVLQDPKYASRLGTNLREKVKSLLDRDQVNELERQCYLRVLSQRPATR